MKGHRTVMVRGHDIAGSVSCFCGYRESPPGCVLLPAASLLQSDRRLRLRPHECAAAGPGRRCASPISSSPGSPGHRAVNAVGSSESRRSSAASRPSQTSNSSRASAVRDRRLQRASSAAAEPPTSQISTGLSCSRSVSVRPAPLRGVTGEFLRTAGRFRVLQARLCNGRGSSIARSGDC